MFKNVILFIFLLVGNLLFSEERQLKIGQVKETMEELFGYHVEYKELSPLLIKRSFKNYIEQFDRSKIYLLDQESHYFLHLTEDKARRIIANFKSGDLSNFAELNLVIQKAILRAQNWRREIAQELSVFELSELQNKRNESYLNFASTEAELKERIKQQLIKLLLEEKKLHQLSHLTLDEKAKIFQLWERRFNKKENPYLVVQSSDAFFKEKGEHDFSLHVLKALTKSLDAHSAYFSPVEAEEMRMSLEKQFDGIGVVLREGIEGIFIVEMIKGSPADKSGKLSPGDRILEIDREPITGLSFEDVLGKLKGKKADITLKVERKKAQTAKTYTVPLKREKIILNDERLNYTFEPFGDGIIGKINLTSFYESGASSSAEKDLKEAIKELKKKGKLLGIVLDFRENSGGFLNQAVKVASLFILRGVVVVSKYAQGEIKYMRELDGRIYFDGPLIILTSKASASAAEIVAGALQDYGAALIVGDDRTYGKGTIQYQTVTEPDAKAYYKVTVGRYYTVSGRSAQIEGIKADIVVPTELANYNIGERFLEYPLPNDRMPPFYEDTAANDEKNWLQKNYLQTPRMPIFPWAKMGPALAQNSFHRINKDKNFSLFLKTLDSEPKAFKKAAWGIDDLQLREAVYILKDALMMQSAQK